MAPCCLFKMVEDYEQDFDLLAGFSKKLYPSSTKPWTEVKDSQTPLSVDNTSDEKIKADNQVEVVNQYDLPPELMEKIVSYFDGKTLFQFKLLSKSSYTIANNAILYNKLWKKFCLNEIPWKYLVDIFNKRFSKRISIHSLTELEYERLYKHWFRWQNNELNVTVIAEKHFLCADDISKIMCQKLNVIVVFSKCLSMFLIEEDTSQINGYILKNKLSEYRVPQTVVTLNPHKQIRSSRCSNEKYISLRTKGPNLCPLHSHMVNEDNGNPRKHTGDIIDVVTNLYVSRCCWIRESWYGYYSNIERSLKTEHKCDYLGRTIFASVVHEIIIGRLNHNNIIVHEMRQKSCFVVHSWLDRKYIEATAVYMYTNMLFVGTKNGYLLVYRLNRWNDFIALKNNNMLLERQMNIGQIVRIDIIDFKRTRAIVVASKSSVIWLKFD